jgi:hypothetical protein
VEPVGPDNFYTEPFHNAIINTYFYFVLDDQYGEILIVQAEGVYDQEDGIDSGTFEVRFEINNPQGS